MMVSRGRARLGRADAGSYLSYRAAGACGSSEGVLSRGGVRWSSGLPQQLQAAAAAQDVVCLSEGMR